MQTSSLKVIAIGCVIAIAAGLVSLAIGATDMASVLFVIAALELLGSAIVLVLGRLARRTKHAS